ncbi:MmcQ/YjbR family DNA-binding protein [Coprobacillaceae bacterium CR2/5/TPMF4]|nr:MmcQ/YjbR family DNA-binding protein [Coprobacillaceae bacterium CR2/5/TPMF4]
MNKDNWITIILDGRVELEEIYQLIDNSYQLSLHK